MGLQLIPNVSSQTIPVNVNKCKKILSVVRARGRQ